MFRRIHKLCGFQKSKPEIAIGGSNSLEKYLETKLSLFLHFKENYIKFPIFENPIVSIVIVNYNQPAFLLECLSSILLNVESPIEVIILDNNSNAVTRELLDRIQNARIILEEKNLDFILGNNKAASFSKAKYLYFLNNDTFVSKKAIENLLKVFSNDRKAGIVGSKLIRTNGNLQEAGCMVWADGTVEAYGKNSQTPFNCSFNFLREVDFCSGASIMIEKELFEKLNGFSTIYQPAYYEDADLCIRCKNIGAKVFFQPASLIIHKENGNITGRAKSLNEKNHPIFYNEHKNYLRTIITPNLIFHQRGVRKTKRVLFIDDELPDVLNGAGQPRTKAFLDFLILEDFQVTFFPIYNNIASLENLDFYQQKGVEVFDRSDNPGKFLYERKGLYDYVVVSRPHNALKVYKTLCWLFPNANFIYDAEALFFSREIEKADFENKPLDDSEKKTLKANEINLVRKFNKIIMVSEKEKNQILPELPDKEIHVWELPYKTRWETPSFISRNHLLYMGGLTSQNQPNVDGILFFANRIFPKIRGTIPDLKLNLIGKLKSDQVKLLINENIQSFGSIKNIEPFFNSAKIFICPQPYGAGISLKLLEAMSYGLPCVASEVATRGLPSGENGVITVSSEKAYIDAIINLYQNEELWEKLKTKNLEYMDRNFSHSILHDKFRAIF